MRCQQLPICKLDPRSMAPASCLSLGQMFALSPSVQRGNVVSEGEYRLPSSPLSEPVLGITAWFACAPRRKFSAPHMVSQSAISHAHPERYRFWQGLAAALERSCLAAQWWSKYWFSDTDHFVIGQD